MSRQWEFAPIKVASLKVLVISDTHTPTIAQRLPKKILEESPSSDVMVRAGDLVLKSVLDQLSSISPLYCEMEPAPGVWASLPASRVVSVERLRFGIAHVHEGRGLHRPMRALSISSKGSVECGRRL